MLIENLIALTKNPRVDSVVKRVDEMKTRKTTVSNLAKDAKQHLKNARKSMIQLDEAMLNAYKAELGDMDGTGERVLSPEEKKLVSDLERVVTRCNETLNRVLDAYTEHLEDLVKKSITFSTPDEQSRLAAYSESKKKYNKVRTVYSDQMIDADSRLAEGKDISETLKQRMEETKEKYDEASGRVIEDGHKYEIIYREEIAQRVSAHFTAEQQLLRGVGSAMKDLYPITRGFNLKAGDESRTSWE